MTQRPLLLAAPKKMIGEHDNEKATRLALSSMHAKNAYFRRVSLDALKVRPHHWSHVYNLLDSSEFWRRRRKWGRKSSTVWEKSVTMLGKCSVLILGRWLARMDPVSLSLPTQR